VSSNTTPPRLQNIPLQLILPRVSTQWLPLHNYVFCPNRLYRDFQVLLCFSYYTDDPTYYTTKASEYYTEAPKYYSSLGDTSITEVTEFFVTPNHNTAALSYYIQLKYYTETPVYYTTTYAT
jgi:hypothetical protein